MFRHLARTIINTSRTCLSNTRTVSFPRNARSLSAQSRLVDKLCRPSDESGSERSPGTESRSWKRRILTTVLVGGGISLGAYAVSKHYRPEDLPGPLRRRLEELTSDCKNLKKRVLDTIIPESKAEEVFKLYTKDFFAMFETFHPAVAEKYPEIVVVLPPYANQCLQIENLAADSLLRALFIKKCLDGSDGGTMVVSPRLKEFQDHFPIPDNYYTASIEEHAMEIARNLHQIAELEKPLDEAFERVIMTINSYPSSAALDDLRAAVREFFNGTANCIAFSNAAVKQIDRNVDILSSYMIARGLGAQCL